MKTLKVLFFAILFGAGTMVNANVTDKAVAISAEEMQSIRGQVAAYVDQVKLERKMTDKANVYLIFKVNEQGLVEVLNVYGKNRWLNFHTKSSLDGSVLVVNESLVDQVMRIKIAYIPGRV